MELLWEGERVVCKDGTEGSVWRERLDSKLLEVEEGVEE